MSNSITSPIDPDDLIVLSKTARLELSPGRAKAVAPAFDGILQLLDALDTVDLGETPPTNSFDARWRKLA